MCAGHMWLVLQWYTVFVDVESFRTSLRLVIILHLTGALFAFRRKALSSYRWVLCSSSQCNVIPSRSLWYASWCDLLRLGTLGFSSRLNVDTTARHRQTDSHKKDNGYTQYHWIPFSSLLMECYRTIVPPVCVWYYDSLIQETYVAFSL